MEGPPGRSARRPIVPATRLRADACSARGERAGTPEEEFLARQGQRRSSARRTAPQNQRRGRGLDNEGIIPVLARAVREVEAAVQRGPVAPSVRTKFQVVALLVREERARVKAEESSSEAKRVEQLKRLDGVATILAKTAARDTSLLALLAEDAVVSEAGRSLKRDMMKTGGVETAPDDVPPAEPATTTAATDRRVVPQSVVSRQLANPFLAPDFASARQSQPRPRRLAGWELLGPLFRSFEYASGGTSNGMALPAPASLTAPGGLELMPHQAQLIAAAASGHRTFLLADDTNFVFPEASESTDHCRIICVPAITMDLDKVGKDRTD